MPGASIRVFLAQEVPCLPLQNGEGITLVHEDVSTFFPARSFLRMEYVRWAPGTILPKQRHATGVICALFALLDSSNDSC